MTWLSASSWRARGSPALAPRLARSRGVGLRGVIPEKRARAWARAVNRARAQWTEDFGGEQFALGRAFYTHLETGRSASYFRDVEASDARVEAALPGLQTFMRELMGVMVGGVVRQRPGFCAAGVHVFPAGEHVAQRGGIVHFDLEGLTPHQLARRARAVTLVVMLQAPARGGGLELWDATWQGRSEPDPDDLPSPRAMRSRPGDAVLIEAYRLHQIEAFTGELDRISATLHAAEIDRDVWETWF
jgi:hypothetical protein